MPESPSITVEENLFVVGSSHQTAPLEVREKIAIDPARMDELYERLSALNNLHEYLVLNTCNRTEIYCVAGDDAAREQVARLFLDFHGLDPAGFRDYVFRFVNHQAVEHVFQVSSGLDSQMVGETEIFGKDAYADAQKRATVGPVLNRVFQKCFKEVKWARTHTGIAKGQVSIGSIAVDLAARIFGNLDPCRILILGSGNVAEATGQALLSRGSPLITISNRTFEKAVKLAHRLKGSAMDFRDFREHLANFDIIISSTSAPGFVIERKDIAQAMKQRPANPMFLIDAAVPRDIDPAVQNLDSVFLYNLDDLSKIANENLQSRLAEVDIVKKTFAQRAWNLWLTVFRRNKLKAFHRNRQT